MPDEDKNFGALYVLIFESNDATWKRSIHRFAMSPGKDSTTNGKLRNKIWSIFSLENIFKSIYITSVTLAKSSSPSNALYAYANLNASTILWYVRTELFRPSRSWAVMLYPGKEEQNVVHCQIEGLIFKRRCSRVTYCFNMCMIVHCNWVIADIVSRLLEVLS